MPTSSTVTMASAMGQPCSYSRPMRALDSPSMEATERSISPTTTIRVSGSAMMAISPMLKPMKKMLVVVKKWDEVCCP